MAFPAVQARNTSSVGSAGTSHTVSLPAGITSGDLLMVAFSYAVTGNTITWPGGWTEFGWSPVEQTGGGTNGLACAFRQADGTEGATISVGTSVSTRSAHVSYRISGHENPATELPQGASALAQNSSGDPPSLTPTGGAKDYLWLAVSAGSEDTVETAAPASYTDLQAIAGTGGGGAGTKCVIATAERQLNAASENPGAFSGASASSDWAAATIAIHPTSAAGAFSLDAQPGSYALTGTIASVPAGRKVNANPGSYAVTGATASVPAGRALSASPGSYTVTGSVAGALAARALSALPGSYTVTGAVANLVFGAGAAAFEINAEPGSYTVTGTASSPITGRVVNASAGSYALSGSAAGLLAAHVLGALSGSYTLTGFDAALVLPGAYTIDAAPGAYTLTGNAAGTLAARALNAASGSYTLTGTAAEFATTRMLLASPGSYALTGSTAGLDHSGGEAVVLHFGPPSPNRGVGQASPTGTFFAPASPGQGTP